MIWKKPAYKRILRIVLTPVTIFLGALVLYLVLALIPSLIPVNRKSLSQQNQKYIYLATNGVHADIVLPATDSAVDWFKSLDIDTLIQPYVKFISFGWGDKQFYINTPEWSDLKFDVAFQAVFLKGQSAMHVSPHRNISEGKNVIKIPVSEKQYLKLIEFIQKSFEENKAGNFIKIDVKGHGKYDLFYVAKRTYNLFYTCNTWVNDGFKSSGMKACLWTPSDKGVLHMYKKLQKKYP
ncbi:MAG: TIGR02117 family protein [Bacteroidales bacterium]|nr:TIGR02117 family protein [Bacteroidales bacterium]MBN2819124.1 TIGR02117 family protein [Bacteroidales bacterium]